jgi:hypothetical protein
MTTCIVCGGVYVNSSLPGLVRCASCGFISANLSLPLEALKRLYSSDYFQGQEYRDYVADRVVIEKHFRMRLDKLLEFIPDPSSRCLLEVGCAYGFFLSVASQSFATVEGLDISPLKPFAMRANSSSSLR